LNICLIRSDQITLSAVWWL